MTTIVNGRLLWEWSNALIMTGNATFSFNWYNIANGTTTRVRSCNSDDIWAIDFETFKYAMQDWWGVLWRYFRTHTINITLSIQEETHEKLLTLMDEIKYQCSAVEAPLRIKSWDVVREWTATCTAIKFNREYFNINWLWNVELTFQATNPHSHALKPLSLNITSESWLYKYSIWYLGRATSYFTILMIIETAWTYSVYYKLNWFTLRIASRSYQVWDIIIFDWPTKKVSINDNEVEYTWSFRPLNYWDNPLEIYYWWTYTATLSYYENYL